MNEQEKCSIPGEENLMINTWLRQLLSGADHADAVSDPYSFFSHPPVIETPDLLLRPVRMRDARDIFSYASDPDA